MFCPACHHHFWENDLVLCPDCGATLPMMHINPALEPVGSWEDFISFDRAGFSMMLQKALGVQLRYLWLYVRAVPDRAVTGSLDFLANFDAEAVKADFETDGLLYLAGMPQFNYNLACDMLYCFAKGNTQLQDRLKALYWDDLRIEGFFDRAVALRNDLLSPELKKFLEKAKEAARHKDKPESDILHAACRECAEAVDSLEAARVRLAEALGKEWFSGIADGLEMLRKTVQGKNARLLRGMQCALEKASLDSWKAQMRQYPDGGHREECLELLEELGLLLHDKRFPNAYRKELVPSYGKFLDAVRRMDKEEQLASPLIQ